MASLYELTEMERQLQSLLESEEISQEVFEDTLEGLDVETKIESICKVIRNLDSDAKAFKEEKDRLAARQKTAENGVKRLKDSLLNYLLVTDKKSVKAGFFNVSVRNSESLNVLYEDMIPEDYLIQQPAKVDVSGIKAAIKEGKEIDGVELVKSPYVTIR